MISLLCPSRGRPQNLRRMIESVRAVSTIMSEVVVYVDDDDTAYSDLALFSDICIFRGPRICHSDYWNKCAERASGDYLMMVGDDCVFKTPGWDQMVEQAFAVCPDKILMVHGDDCAPAGKWFATHPIISRRWVEICGRFTGPWFPGDFADQWIQDIANTLGRRQFLPFVNEHLHHVWGKAPKDQTYCETEARKRDQDTPSIYGRMTNERTNDVIKLRAAMDENWKVPK